MVAPTLYENLAVHIDVQQFKRMYGDDPVLMAGVIRSSLIHLRQEIAQAGEYIGRNEVSSLRSVLHRMKPLSGYLGLTTLQQDIQALEERCIDSANMAELSKDFSSISQKIMAVLDGWKTA